MKNIDAIKEAMKVIQDKYTNIHEESYKLWNNFTIKKCPNWLNPFNRSYQYLYEKEIPYEFASEV